MHWRVLLDVLKWIALSALMVFALKQDYFVYVIIMTVFVALYFLCIALHENNLVRIPFKSIPKKKTPIWLYVRNACIVFIPVYAGLIISHSIY